LRTDFARRLHLRRVTDTAGLSRNRGDAARDSKNWAVAEQEYAAHLATAPGDQPIWVQYGHCLKEQGKRVEAETAYRRAIELAPEDADAHLQLGHVLKLLDRKEDAQQAYLASVGLKPTKAAIEEVQGLGGAAAVQSSGALALAHDSSGTIYLEIDDLLDYLRSYRTVSGIQRVQVGVIQHAITQPATEQGAYAFIRTGRNTSGFWRLDPADLLGILDYIKQPFVSQARLLSIIEAAEQNATLVEPVRGQFYFILGAFWGFGSNAARYAKLKRAGLHVGVYIYDLIPITHPEYCSAGLVSEFTFALGDGLHVFDFILTISEYVAEDVRRFLAKNNLRPIPVEAVPLAHQIHDVRTDVPAALQAVAWQGVIAPLQHRPFVLMVSTIEPRKNHIYLYYVWKALLEEGLDPPDLVFVGRYGWRVNDLRDMLEGTRFLGGRIHVLHDLSDVSLELLYRSCLFTAFPSVMEGWGLPVGESLTHGRPSVASNTSSIPEVGGDFVDYIDPWNVHDGIRVFRKMITDNAYRSTRAKNIKDKFVPRTWSDVGADLLVRFAKFRKLPNTGYVPVLLAPGELLMVSDLAADQLVPVGYPSRPLRTLFAECWFHPEHDGVWMRGLQGSLCFSTGLKPGTRVTAYLLLKSAPWCAGQTVSALVGTVISARTVPVFPATGRADSETCLIEPNARLLIRAVGTVDQDGTITIQFSIAGEAPQDHPARNVRDNRDFTMGIVALSYAASSDVELRIDLHERFSALSDLSLHGLRS